MLYLKEFISDPEWYSVPSEIISREGIEIDTSTNVWDLPIVTQKGSLNFERVKSYGLRWSMQKYLIDQIERISSISGLNYWNDFSRLIIANENEYKLVEADSIEVFKERLISLMGKIIAKAKSEQNLWGLYRTIQWYIWCSESFSEIGFCPIYAQELEAMRIPGNPKGEGVRGDNPDKRPLDRSLELPLLIKALKEDSCKEFHCLQEKAAMALTIAFGRNPSNLTYLKESDLSNITQNHGKPCYTLRIPRTKKRLINARDDFTEEFLIEDLALIVKELIDANKAIDTRIEIDGKMVEIERPIFLNKDKNSGAINSKQFEFSFNMTTPKQTKLIKDFVERHKIISPLTKELLYITTRRLRYTLACGLAAEGMSKRELARVLDHTDTQHVHVYYEVANAIIEHLDKATAKGFAKYLDLFKGKIIDNDDEAINGDRDDKRLSFTNESNPKDQSEIGVCGKDKICHLDPPYSCYLCPKFQPYRHADHDHVLRCLLADREQRMEKYEKARIGVQLDQVIAAVAQVAKICSKGATHA